MTRGRWTGTQAFRRPWLVAAALLIVTLWLPALAAAPQVASAAVPDPSKHQVRYVTVDQGVTLEVLDWGGSGRPLVLLAGSGSTAHVFDEFAPKLLDCCHVYAVTRRGYGTSSRPSTGYDDQRLADDVFQAIEKERIARPVLVGHSMAGGEMTTIGRQHSDRVSGLIYLDALGDLEDDPPADKEWAELQQKLPAGLQPARTCAPEDRSSFAAYRESLACRMGFALPESELRQGFESIDGRVAAFKTPGWVSREIGQAQVFRRDYSNIRVPVLALMNGALTTEETLAGTGYQPKNDEERLAIDRFMARSRIVFGRWTDKLKRHVPDARIVYFPNAGHYVFLTREADILREIHGFVAALDKKAAPVIEEGRDRDDGAGRRLARVQVSPERVVRTIVGLRPFRRSGFRVEVEPLGDTLLVHNYGHGGCGVTLSWGTASLATDRIVESGRGGPVAVIGCGAVGLATARLLQIRGFAVTIYARALPPDTTSNVAGALWYPHLLVEDSSRTAAFDTQFERAARLSHRHFQDLIGESYGVSWRRQYSLSRTPQPDSWDVLMIRDLFPESQPLRPGEHPFGPLHVTADRMLFTEPAVYLEALLRDFRLGGGRVEVHSFASPAELAALPERMVVNCTGLGARDLFGDSEVMPVKGQLTVLLPQPEIDYAWINDEDLYMFPRRDGILLGGTHEPGVESLEPNRAAERQILERHKAVVEAMT